MSTSMKRIEIYTSKDGCKKLAGILEEEKLYWYMEEVRLKGGEKICRVTVYAPLHAIEGIVARVSEALDLRKIENMVAVSDVEAGIGAPYRITGWRFLDLVNSFAKRPRFMLLEDAGERARVSSAQVLLVVLAGLVALTGLMINNPYVIIGAMLLSPILGPIYAFSVLLVLSKPEGAFRSLVSLTLLVGAAFTVSLLAVLAARIIGHEPRPTGELLLRARFGWDSIIVPLLLGMASLLAVSSNVTEALTGVAIAAALIPPASALGWAVAAGSIRLGELIAANLGANLVGLLLGSYLMGLMVMARHVSHRKAPT